MSISSPQKCFLVYVWHRIEHCDNGYYSSTEIIDELNNHTFLDNDDNKIFFVKCGEQNVDCFC